MVATKMGMLTPPGNMPMQPMAQPAPPMQAPMPPAMMTRNNAGRRRGFGDYLENMLDRPMMAADNMGDFDVFTGQPVVQMRRGGSVSDYNSKAFSDYVASKSNTFAPTRGTPGRAVKTHDEIMASIRGGSSPNDDKPAPVVVTRDDDYTPTSAELNEQMKDLAAVGMPDLRQDQFEVDMPMFPDLLDETRENLADYSAFQAMVNKYGTQGDPDDRATILAPGTGGLGSVDPVSTGSGMQFGETPIGLMPGASFGQTSVGGGLPGASFGQTSVGGGLPGMSFGQQPVGGGMPADPNTFISDVFETPPVEAKVGGGRGAGPGGVLISGGTNLPSEDDMTIKDRINKMIQDFKAVPGNIANDLKMAMAAGLFGSRNQRYKNLLDAGYTPEQANKFLDDSEATMKKMMDEQRRLSDQDGDDEKVVNPCQPGYVLDPATNICVPESEVSSSEGGDSVSLNRARDDEFAELDDIMKIIEKPANMKAGGMAGLNRVADGFLAAMGG
tara:strand:+ start:1307 stop:2803 length:1497 start_codon:yes stop_codon:yes gene_type:complete